MPKRSFEKQMERYSDKIKQLQEKVKKRRKRIIVDSSDSSSDEHSDNELQVPGFVEEMSTTHLADIAQEGTSPEATSISDLDPDILLALGEIKEDTPKFGEKIHDNLARLWLPILRKGLDKEAKEKLIRDYLIPENCTLLQAPKLNPEIAATISDVTRTKDKRVETAQQQLGVGISALNRGLSLLIGNDSDKVKAIKSLSDSCRLLCDLHSVETAVRKKFMTPGLDKEFLNLIQDVERDDTLFGQKLSDKIKASKAIEKQSLQIKKPAPVKMPAPAVQPSTSRPRMQGNWTGPPRYSSNRGGRSGSKKTAPAGRKGPLSLTTKHSAQTQNHNKPRAPAPQQ